MASTIEVEQGPRPREGSSSSNDSPRFVVTTDLDGSENFAYRKMFHPRLQRAGGNASPLPPLPTVSPLSHGRSSPPVSSSVPQRPLSKRLIDLWLSLWTRTPHQIEPPNSTKVQRTKKRGRLKKLRWPHFREGRPS